MQQEILAANPNAKVRVFAVWFNMLPRDSRGGFPADLLTDSRVTQFWDEDHLVGEAFAPLADWHKGVLWDAYFLYGPDARWREPVGAGLAPAQEGRPQGSPLHHSNSRATTQATTAPALPQPASWGRTIFSTREQLKKDFDKIGGM